MAKQISVEEYVQKIIVALNEHGDPEIALRQMAYLKNKFDFFGVKTPVRTAVVKPVCQTFGFLQGEDLKHFVRSCYEQPQREMQYVALEMIHKTVKNEKDDFIYFLEELIITKSWWDSVDGLAPFVAIHFARFPHQIKPVTEGWMASNNMWLQRMAITFQRYFKKITDADMLFDYVLRLSHSTEFFIQKGSGWALREYSKVNPQAVLDFVKNNTLPPLTKREAIRLII